MVVEINAAIQSIKVLGDLIKANRSLRNFKETVELKDWNHEAERYQLAEISSGVFAYQLKPGMERGEPLHLPLEALARHVKPGVAKMGTIGRHDVVVAEDECDIA